MKFGGIELVITQVYAPIAVLDNVDSEEFYRTLNKTINSMKRNMRKRVIIMGDFNSQIGRGRK